MSVLKIEWLGEPLWLLCGKAVYRSVAKTLLVADTHFGKVATFRQAGIPLPHGTTAANLHRLSALLNETGAERLVVLGDFLHAAAGRAPATMAAINTWRDAHRTLQIQVIRGNHDLSAGDPPAEWQIECLNEMVEPPLVYLHHPRPHASGYALCGHLHPSIRMYDRSGPPLKAACYWFGRDLAVMPAFGGFTGTMNIEPSRGDRVFVVGPDAVVEVPPRRSFRRSC